MKNCPKCGYKSDDDSRFCEQCRFDYESIQEAKNAISIGDKNVIAGDVVAHKEIYSIAGNATIVTNDDESKKMVQCAICGKNMPIAQSFECRECHQIVCDACFDKSDVKCKKCVMVVTGASEDSYRVAITEALADGKIDIADRKKLIALQKQLGIVSARAIQIEKEMKSATSCRDMKNTASVDRVNTEKAFMLLYNNGDYKKASELMAPICERHPNDEAALSIYLAALAKFNPVKVKSVVAKIQADVLCGALAQIDIDIKHKDFSSAERRIDAALGIWPNSVQLKCRKVVYAYEYFMFTEDSSPLMEAVEFLESIEETVDPVDRSWKYYARRLMDSALGEESVSLDRAQCDKDGLLWDIVSAAEDKSASLYCIIDISAGPEAAFYPTYYMDTDSTTDWTDEFKTDLIVLRHIMPGSFMMGSDAGRKYNSPPHVVTLTHSFYIGVFEVTQRQWELVSGKRPSCFNNDEYYKKRPVERVSYEMIRGKRAGLRWPDAKGVDSDSFIGLLRKKTYLKELDLPTESQWEYACRAGVEKDYYDGSDIGEDSGELDDRIFKIAVWNRGPVVTDEFGYSCADLSLGTGEVGLLAPNKWGLYDMIGNVQEYCLDVAVNICSYFREIDPMHKSSGDCYQARRRVRGGCWNNDDYESVSSWYGRYNASPGSADCVTGLRLAIQLESSPEVKNFAYGSDLELVSVSDSVVCKCRRDREIDMMSAYLYARCLEAGLGGLVVDRENASLIIERLAEMRLPLAECAVAKRLLAMVDAQVDVERRNEARGLLQDAADSGLKEAIALIKKLTKLSSGCVSAVKEIFTRYASNAGRRRGESFNLADPNDSQQVRRYGIFLDAVKEIFDYDDDMISRNVLAFFAHEYDCGGTRGAMFTDDGIYTLNTDDNPVASKPNTVLRWDEFVEHGHVRDIPVIGYIQIFDDPDAYVYVGRQFSPIETDKAVSMFSEIQRCVKEFGMSDIKMMDEYSKSHVEELPLKDVGQKEEIGGLSNVDDSDNGFRIRSRSEGSSDCVVVRDKEALVDDIERHCIENRKKIVGESRLDGCQTVAEQKECPSCHAKWPISVKFCGECGCMFK